MEGRFQFSLLHRPSFGISATINSNFGFPDNEADD